MRNPLTLVLVIAAAVGALTIGAGRAGADVAPPDSCTSPGQPCQNAGPQFDSAGTCTAGTCTKQVPAPDGGTMSMTYDCNRCTANGGAGGSGAGATSGSSSSSGCRLAPTGGDGGGAAAAILLIATLVSIARRRRTPIG